MSDDPIVGRERGASADFSAGRPRGPLDGGPQVHGPEERMRRRRDWRRPRGPEAHRPIHRESGVAFWSGQSFHIDRCKMPEQTKGVLTSVAEDHTNLARLTADTAYETGSAGEGG